MVDFTSSDFVCESLSTSLILLDAWCSGLTSWDADSILVKTVLNTSSIAFHSSQERKGQLGQFSLSFICFIISACN